MKKEGFGKQKDLNQERRGEGQLGLGYNGEQGFRLLMTDQSSKRDKNIYSHKKNQGGREGSDKALNRETQLATRKT